MREDVQPVVYLLASHRNGTLYTGVTSNLPGRIVQHRSGAIRGFTSDYWIKRLVWFEVHSDMRSAIQREKRIKKWNRAWKIALVEQGNPDWRDLAIDLGFEMVASTRLVPAPNRHPRESGDPASEHRPPDNHPNPSSPRKRGPS